MLKFYTNPQSRGQIAHWMLEEVGQPYDTVVVRFGGEKPADFLAANPMGKVPALAVEGDSVTEAAAIIAYLAARFPEANLGPRPDELAPYYRWMFFAAGPVEQAVVGKSMGWEVTEGREGMVGFGTFDRTIKALDDWLGSHHYVCGDRFTAADVYVGSQVDWGLQFGSIPASPALTAYAERLRARDAYKRTKAINAKLIEGS